jgi:hypothetical protein
MASGYGLFINLLFCAIVQPSDSKLRRANGHILPDSKILRFGAAISGRLAKYAIRLVHTT